MSTTEISVAPMMAYTDRHYRYLARLIAPAVVLYTEMLNCDAVINNDDRFFAFDGSEHPVVVQLGGNDPHKFAKASTRLAEAGYDAINLNIGCPSERVQSGSFGACLMREPQLVADCVKAIKEVVKIPVSVKTRIGVDHDDSYQFLTDFVATVQESGCQEFIIHARKAWLKGLSPKQNREVPPLDYERVYQLKRDFPDLKISINGGVRSVDDVNQHKQFVDGIMIGRAAYDTPWLLRHACAVVTGDEIMPISYSLRVQIVVAYLKYMQAQVRQGTPLKVMSRHLIHLFDGQPGARGWRQSLSELMPSAELTRIEDALQLVAP